MGLFGKKKITLPEFPDLEFIPFHQLKKENDNNDPYMKTIKQGSLEFTFFKLKGTVYAIKPTSKNDSTKWLCVPVKNKLTKESASNSITGNCAKGITEEFRNYLIYLINQGYSQEDIFYYLVTSTS